MSLLSTVIYKITYRNWSRWQSIPKIDPGINLRKKIVDSIDDDFDDLETDFMNVHKTHKEHVAEIKKGLEKEKFHIVKQKYFKEKHLNFLTWYDKEHIRYLHNSDPDEWTIEKLSEGFPALPMGIKKIIKSKWTIDPKRISNHDKSVQNNWENFKTGQIPNLPNDLVCHLKKFTNRALNLKPFEAPQYKAIAQVNLKPTVTEFSEIITSYNNLIKKKECIDTTTELTVINRDTLNIKSDIKIKRNSKKNEIVTLNELQDKLENKLSTGKKLSEDEKLMLQNFNQPSSREVNTIELNNDLDDITKNKYETKKGSSLVKKTTQDFSHLTYPEKILIPENLMKRGYTYKLNDCYYDDDGVFMYRVPGMY